MSRLESIKSLLRRWFSSIPLFVFLGLALGAAITIPVIPQPKVAILPISGDIMQQSYTDEIMEALQKARQDRSIRAVVLEVDSPGGYVVTVEAIYLEVLRLRREKPVVASIKMTAASGGYYIAAATNYIYAGPTSQVGSIGAYVDLPRREALDEETLTTGLFKATGGSKRRAMVDLEMVRQEFVDAVMSQRGERLKLSKEELSQAELYLGVESFRHGLVDAIGTNFDAIEKAAQLAGIRNYDVVKLYVSTPLFPWFLSLSDNSSPAGMMPVYYYLYFESE